MKVRQGFVSNSSSSSFVIETKDLDSWQKAMIHDHKEVVSIMPVFKENGLCEDGNCFWLIEETLKGEIEGSTSMDNFDMRLFLEVIGVSEDKIQWGS